MKRMAISAAALVAGALGVGWTLPSVSSDAEAALTAAALRPPRLTHPGARDADAVRRLAALGLTTRVARLAAPSTPDATPVTPQTPPPTPAVAVNTPLRPQALPIDIAE